MNDRAVRICYLFSLTYLVVFILFFSQLAAGFLGLSVRTSYAACMIFTGAAVFGIWRRYVSWTDPRTISTSALTLVILILMAATYQIRTDFRWAKTFVFGLSFLLLGLWLAGCCWVWWKELMTAAGECSAAVRMNRRPSMSPDAARLALSGALVPLLPGIFYLVWGITAIGLWTPHNSDEILWAAMQACSIAGIAFWLALWKRHVVWTSRRTRVTAILAVILLLAPFSALIPRGIGSSGLVDFSAFFDSLRYGLPFLAAAAWFGGTARAWRSAPLPMTNDPGGTEKPYAVHCPHCTYNLTGLREVRCPECGWASTVDDLVNRTLAEWSALAYGSV